MDKKKYFWVDVEATGLDIDKCSLCEIAAVVTDDQLREVDVWSCVINARTAYWEEYAMEMHMQNSLWQDMKNGCTLQQAKNALEGFAAKHAGEHRFNLAGSSVYFDKAWIEKLLGRESFSSRFSHQLVDVTSIKIEIESIQDRHVFEDSPEFSDFVMQPHRALYDIRRSIALLRKFRARGWIGGGSPAEGWLGAAAEMA